ncbi:hypothetical protein BDV95DRAFT_590967 [Massariosphaeria phaeospora]|uniref:Uncharacterized protein n=1 Tax=Massariosphaeria phaeospora TaxID=100035 RepID=A0A7C8IG25_9PLEO|nr:hypothetical protein BDV95DRAFT_590967 [Massariosphaeria phaeospora]
MADAAMGTGSNAQLCWSQTGWATQNDADDADDAASAHDAEMLVPGVWRSIGVNGQLGPASDSARRAGSRQGPPPSHLICARPAAPRPRLQRTTHSTHPPHPQPATSLADVRLRLPAHPASCLLPRRVAHPSPSTINRALADPLADRQTL